MDGYTGSDLACECTTETGSCSAGISKREQKIGDFRLCKLRVETEDAAERLGKAVGTYITVDCGRIHLLSEDNRIFLAHILSEELREMSERLSGKEPDAGFDIFVAGLGNAELTADAIGPKTVRRLNATRHLREQEQYLYRMVGCCALSAFAPGVLGQTGIETLELLKGTVPFVHPDVILVVDALAARSCSRLATTIQITDAGIAPGSGVGNHRSAITQSTVGVPVIALGVPTVVNSSVLVYDALREAGIREIAPALQDVLSNGKSFFVSPKESDIITEQVSRLLADAIGMAFTGNL